MLQSYFLFTIIKDKVQKFKANAHTNPPMCCLKDTMNSINKSFVRDSNLALHPKAPEFDIRSFWNFVPDSFFVLIYKSQGKSVVNINHFMILIIGL